MLVQAFFDKSGMFSPFLLPYFPGLFGYYDDSHVSATGAVYLWPLVCGVMDDAGLFQTT
tara:strand:- start:440 stop:616 length:177 start_codon:yes stop_codon:yes gene_type:complete